MRKLPFLLLFCFPLALLAQEGNVAAGGEYSGAGGTMSNSTGQTDFITLTSDEVNIQFGLQQVFYEESGVPTDNLVQNILIPNDSSYCFNATQTITTGGDGTTFVVESGGEAELIAGLNILMMPGTHAHSGSHLLARISTDGFYCDGRQPVIVEAPTAKTQLVELPAEMKLTPDEPLDYQKGMASFKVYPNPTRGLFTLEMNGVDEQEKTSITIYGVRGERIQQSEIKGEQFTVFSLEDQRPGIYFIQILSNKLVGVKRIIKQ